MIHCLTSSYDRDFIRATALNQNLMANGVTHHLFVEQKDFAKFKQLENEKTLVHVKPDGGDGGLGRSGTMVRYPCYKKMQEFLSEGDTFIQLDSDVILVDAEIIIKALKCDSDEIRGFYNQQYPTHLQRDESIPPTDVRFSAMSGMTICAGYEAFNKAIPKTEGEMLEVVEFLLSEGFTPSEDVVLSFLLQRGEFRLTNLVDSFWRVFHENGDVEILHSLGKDRFSQMYNYNFLKDKMTKAEITDFVALTLYDPNKL